MFKTFKAWLAARVAASQLRQYDKGYTWADKALRAGTSAEEVSQHLGTSWRNAHFHDGAEDALYDWSTT